MKILYSARQLPVLEKYSATERAQIIQLAASIMPVPRRFLTNMLKLVVLVVLFWQLVALEGWVLRIIALLAAGLLYPLLLYPLTLNLSQPYIPEAAERFDQQMSASPEEPTED